MQQCILYMVTLNDYKASSIKVGNICGMKTKQEKKCVTRLLRVSPVLGHSYNTEWIQRIKEFGWD